MDVKKEKKAEEREVSEKEINNKLEEIMDNILAPKEVRLLAKLIFNLRFDLNELKQELIKTFSGEDGQFEIEIALPEEMKKTIRRLSDDYFS